NPDVKCVDRSVAAFASAKRAGASLVCDVGEGLVALREALAGWHVDDAYGEQARAHMADWNAEVDRAFHLGHQPLPAQTEILGALQDVLDPRDVIVQAAGSLPGDLQMLWRAREPKAYNVEYAS